MSVRSGIALKPRSRNGRSQLKTETAVFITSYLATPAAGTRKRDRHAVGLADAEFREEK